jgi:hypothetical protein
MAEREVELCFFCEVTDNSGYDQALATEQHTQFEFRPPPTEDGKRRGRVRVRKTVKNGQTAYTQTIKTPVNPDSKLGEVEETVDITESFFNTWVTAFASPGQVKDRYIFMSEKATLKINGNAVELAKVKYEVDRFYNQAGKKSQWVKIDIEIQDLIEYLKQNYEDVKNVKFDLDLSNLPLGIKRMVSAVTDDPEERAGIENFFKTFSVMPG